MVTFLLSQAVSILIILSHHRQLCEREKYSEWNERFLVSEINILQQQLC
jgi:hypothetical protein